MRRLWARIQDYGLGGRGRSGRGAWGTLTPGLSVGSTGLAWGTGGLFSRFWLHADDDPRVVPAESCSLGLCNI